MYVIIKQIENVTTGTKLPVILLDGHDEVLEFKNRVDADKLCEILNKNTDSGHTYLVKEIA
jgi:hypothetical protein